MARERKRTEEIPVHDDLLPTGCTLLNCALSDSPYAGYKKGTLVNVAGDSSAGKSVCAFTTLAAIAGDSKYDDYRLIYDDAEQGDSFDIEQLFGKKLLKRLEAPEYDKNKEPIYSDTIQDFHMHVKDALEIGKPFIYILDSFDALDSEEDEKKIDEARKAWKKGNPASGSYGTAKAKGASMLLRNIKGDVKRTDSLVIIVSQVRDKLDAVAFGNKKTKSGGKALTHYCRQVIWILKGKKITSKELTIGVTAMVKPEKNRQTGKLRNIEFPIYYDLGVDDIGASINFLIEHGVFGKKKGGVLAPEFDYEGSTSGLIKHIEENNLEGKLQKIVGKKWKEIEDSVKLNRKRRFE